MCGNCITLLMVKSLGTAVPSTVQGDHEMIMQQLGVEHWAHPLLGQRVVDRAHGDRVGVFRAFAPDVDKTRALAVTAPHAPLVVWLAPVGGGREWTSALTAIVVA